MKLSLDKKDLQEYTSAQINHFFPDKDRIKLAQHEKVFDIALDRLDHCFKKVAFDRYFKDSTARLNHLYADHYLMYLWFLSNTFWKESGNDKAASKLYYLNKALHGLDCMYDTKLPDIFLIFHGVGTMLGKAGYADYMVVLQGCTVGSQKGNYPEFGKGVALTANSSVIGKCTLGDRATISTRTTVFQKDVPPDTTAFMDFETGQLQMKTSKTCYAQQFFNVDLNMV